MGWSTLTNLVELLKIVLKWTKKGVVMRIWAATSRRRVFLLAALYYIVYENWAAFTAFEAGFFAWFKSVVFAVGGALLAADKAVEANLRAVVAGSIEPVRYSVDAVVVEYTFVSPELAMLGAVVAIGGALSTIVIYVRAAKAGIQSANRNIGVVGAIGVPVLVYALAVVAVSAVQGNVRIPFQGVYLLVQNLDVVTAVLQPFGGDPGNMTGNLSVPDLPGIDGGNRSVNGSR